MESLPGSEEVLPFCPFERGGLGGGVEYSTKLRSTVREDRAIVLIGECWRARNTVNLYEAPNLFLQLMTPVKRNLFAFLRPWDISCLIHMLLSTRNNHRFVGAMCS